MQLISRTHRFLFLLFIFSILFCTGQCLSEAKVKKGSKSVNPVKLVNPAKPIKVNPILKGKPASTKPRKKVQFVDEVLDEEIGRRPLNQYFSDNGNESFSLSGEDEPKKGKMFSQDVVVSSDSSTMAKPALLFSVGTILLCALFY